MGPLDQPVAVVVVRTFLDTPAGGRAIDISNVGVLVHFGVRDLVSDILRREIANLSVSFVLDHGEVRAFGVRHKKDYSRMLRQFGGKVEEL